MCAPRWQEAFEADLAPRVVLAATHELTTEWCDRAALFALAVDAPDDDA
jgi:uncharacterized protein (DUF2237 family)